MESARESFALASATGHVRGARRRSTVGVFPHPHCNLGSVPSMSMSTPPDLSRRDFVRLSAASLGAAALAASTAPRVFGATAGSDTIRVGVIGCGGRGTGAAQNVLEAAPGVEIVAVADLFERQAVRARDKFKVSPAKCFWGFDAFAQLLQTDVNYMILATPPGFRPAHFAAAVAAGKHIFIEKPVAVDPTGVRSIIATAKLASEKGLSVVAGTQRRHQGSYIETMKRIHGGELGETRCSRRSSSTGRRRVHRCRCRERAS